MTSAPASTEYRRVLEHILGTGIEARDPAGRQRADGHAADHDGSRSPQGFPVITERSVRSFWRKPIGELCAFINGATTLAEFERFGVDWWGPWATPEKTLKKGIEPGGLGPGSYGGAFHSFPTPDGQPFDQFKHLVEQLRELPELRTHFVDPWIAPYQVRGAGKQPRTTIAPCHGWVHVRVLDGGLHVHMTQRSGDVPVGRPVQHDPVRRARPHARAAHRLPGGGVLPHDLRRAHLRRPGRRRPRHARHRAPPAADGHPERGRAGR